jgi:hypothetical protein
MPVTDEQLSGLRVALLGNLEPEFSTENEFRDGYERNGADVFVYQEGDAEAMRDLIDDLRTNPPDFVHWTRTKGLADRLGDAVQWEMLRTAGRAGVPVVGPHLDIWIGFERESQIETDPYFRGVDLMLTADGGHQEAWQHYGVNHRWLLPAISERWLGLGTPQEKYRSKIAFTGSWQGGYHPEAEHRHQLVAWLQETYGDDVRFYPKKGQHAIRGRELNDLYASVDVVVGDSAVLPGKGRYVSDRIPETAGRGGPLLHPWVEGVTADENDPFYYAVVAGWEAGDWSRLKELIDNEIGAYPAGDPMWAHYRQGFVDAIAAGQTYTHRCREIVEIMNEEGLL